MRKRFLILLTGTGIAQAISLLAIPTLTRQYSPEEFGLFGLFVACVGVLGNNAALRYELAVVLPERNEDAAAVFVLCFPVILLMTFLTLLATGLFGRQISLMLDQPAIKPLLWLLPLSVFAFGTFQVLNFWAIRESRVGEVGVAQVSRAVLAATVQIAGGVAGAGAAGLVAGQVAAHAASSLEWLRRTWRRDRRVLMPALDRARVRAAAVRYRAFPAKNAPQTLVNSISQSLPIFLMGLLFAPSTAGFYLLAQRSLQAPLDLVASSLRQSILPRYARAIARGEPLAADFRRLTLQLLLLGLPIAVLLGVGGQQIFVWVFGQEWHTAGRFARWLVIALCLELAIPPASCVLTVLERQGMQLIFEVVMLGGRCLAILWGAWRQDAALAIAAFACVGAGLNGVLILVARHALQTSAPRCAHV